MDRMSKYIDKYSNPNKEDALKGFQQTQRDSQRDERERKRKEEERKRAEERRKHEETRVNSQSIKDLAKDNQSNVERATVQPSSYGSDMFDDIEYISDNEYFHLLNKYGQEKEKKVKPYLDFSNNLENDLNTRIATQKGLGVKDKDIEQDLVPQEDNTIQERLEKLSTQLRPGKEGFVYGIKEGWYEREIQDMLSRESVRKINGLPNEVDKIEKFIEEHPELQREERNTKIEEWLSEGIRGVGRQTKQQVDSYAHALKQPSTYAWAGAITAASIMAAPFTGGGSLAAGGALLATSPLVAGTATSKAIAMLGPVAGMRFGMKAGAYDNMAKLEGRSSYVDLIEAGVDKRIAGPLSETIGAVNGLLEFMQLETAFGAIPGVSDLVGNAKKMALKEFTNKAIKVVGNYGVDLASEVFEEMAQAGVSEMGLELGKYLQDAPDPSTIEGLKVLGKTMTSEDFRDTVLNEGYHALQAMWLTPILSEAGRTGVNQTMQGMYNATERMQIAKISEQENEVARENNKKTMDYIVNENGATDQAIKFVNETLDPQAMAFLASEKTILEDMLQREDITNQDKEKMGGTLEKISTVLSKVMYDEKVENPDIEYRATNRSDVETEILSDGWLDQATPYNEILNYNIELYKQSKDYEVADIIKEGLKKGTNKAEIIRAIEKRVPKKDRKPTNLMSMVNSVELVQKEIEMQIINNTLGNILEVQANNVENIKTESIIQDIQDETKTVEQDDNIDTPQSTTTVDSEVVQGINQPSSENLTQENVVAENVIQEETTTKEVKEEEKVVSKPVSTEKYQSADIKKIPLSIIHIDKETYQFRYDTGNEYGATRKYDGVPFNEDLADAVLLREDEYNDLWMVNGHHRYNKALQSGVEFIDAKIISYKDYTVEEARSLGAMINIAQDNASSIDVAKLIRDTGATEEEFTNMGVRPNSKVKKDGMALANLNDWIFTQVATKGIPIERAIIIGKELSDSPDGQNQIIKTIDNMEVKGKSITNDILTELIAEVKGTAREEFTETTLFGEETFTKNFSIERAELVSYVKSQLKGRVSLLKNVSKNKNAAILQELGNTIAVDDNVKEMNTADQALFILDKTLNYQGTKVNELFNELAREYSDTDNKASVKKRALNELITLMESGNMFELINQQVKKADIQDNIMGEQTNLGLSEQELEQQEELIGQETMMQLKNLEETRIIADDDAKKGVAFRATGKIVEAIKNNPIFNGLTINYSNESGKVENMSKEDLISHGYGHLEETKEKYIYGFYNDGDRTITLNSEATRDTILEEAIHDIQYRLEEIDPSLAVLVSEWEGEVREQALKEGIAIPEGYELLAQALVYTEYGYASTNPFIANLIAVDDEIVDRFTTLLGSDIAERGFGFVESDVAKEDRQLRGKYEEYADRIFKSKYIGKTMEAKQARAAEIVQDLENIRASQYYQPYTNQYVIVGPSTKDGKYQITYFHPEFGPVSDSQYETTQEVADRLVKDGYFYKTDEIHYQLKNYDRSMADELYTRLHLQRGPGTDIDTTSDRGNVSVPINGTDIVRIREAILTGNFTSEDYKVIVKNNDNIYGHDKILLEKLVKDAEKKGLHKPNREVTLKEFLYRFYDVEIGDNNKLSNKDIEKHWLYSIDRAIDKKGYKEKSKEKVKSTLELKDNEFDSFYNSLSKAEADGMGIENIKNRLNNQHKYFQDKTETYRHRGLQYQLKEGLINKENISSILTMDVNDAEKKNKIANLKNYKTNIGRIIATDYELDIAEGELWDNRGVATSWTDRNVDNVEFRPEGAGEVKYVLHVESEVEGYQVQYLSHERLFDEFYYEQNMSEREADDLAYEIANDEIYQELMNLLGSDGDMSNEAEILVPAETKLRIKEINDGREDMGYIEIILEEINPSYQLKAATDTAELLNWFNEQQPNIMYQLKENEIAKPIVNVDGFYSNLENIINDKMGKRAKASDLMNMFRKNGVKPEELEWFEMESVLKGKDFVYKNELLDHMREKSIEFTKENIGNRFNQYTLDGGDNYRFNAYVYNNPGQPFRNETHFGSLANVIAHTRYKDREGPNGEAILLIEEVQSDWHQKGRQEGYQGEMSESEKAARNNLEEVKSKYKEFEDEIDKLEVIVSRITLERNNISSNPLEISGEKKAKYIELDKEIMKINNQIEAIYYEAREYSPLIWEAESKVRGYDNLKVVPDAPLKESVTEFMLKTAIKDAVEGGYDYIAWTTGTQQADRYNISKSVDELMWVTSEDKSQGTLHGFKDRETIVNQSMATNELQNYIGKELALKLLEQESDGYNQFGLTRQTLKGEQMSIGGEFHKKLYDNYIPRALRKYGKKWGVDVGLVQINNSTNSIKVYEDELIYINDIELMQMADDIGVSTEDFKEAKQSQSEDLIFDERNLLEEAIMESLAAKDNYETSDQLSIPVTPKMIGEVMTQGQPIFQLKEEPSTNGNLLAMHNISIGNLKSAIKLGGFPMPSIAITKKDIPFTDFGEISLMFGKNTIDPSNEVNKLFSGDAWTPQFPSIKKTFLGINGEYVEDSMGNQYPVTIENVLEVMKQKGEGDVRGAEKPHGLIDMYVQLAKEYKDIQSIKDDSYKLVNNEEMQEAHQYNYDLFHKITSNIRYANRENSPPIQFHKYVIDTVLEFDRRNGYELSFEEQIPIINNWFDDKNILINEQTVNDVLTLAKRSKDISVDYFESKPIRVVGLDEIQAALIDESKLSGEEELTEIKDMLKSVGVNVVETYSEDNRQQAMDNILRQNDVSFQLKEADTTTPAFKNWFKDSKVAGEEGNPLKVYHGTSNQFSEFRSGYAPGWGEGMYFTDNQENAKDYGNNLYEVYLNIQNPYTDDVRLSYDDLENTRAFKERQGKVPMEEGEYIYGIDARELFDTDGKFANDVIRELGYDGIITEGSNNIEGKEIVVFNPNQIKSVNNQGTWEVNDANIYYQMKEGPDIEERSWGQTVRDSEFTTPWLSELLTSSNFMYEVKHNEDTLIAAAKLLDEKGEEYVESRLLSDIQNDTVLFAASQMLTYKYMEDGEQDRAMNMIEKTAEKATSMGQAIQILSVWGRQTPEGMLRHTHKIFSSAMTDKQKAKVSETTKDYRSTFNELNKKHIREIDLVGNIEQLTNLSDEDLLKEGLKTKEGKELVDKYGIEGLLNQEGISNEDKGTLESFSERTDINTQGIVDIVQKHYEDGKGNLKDKLVKGGMNELEADLLSKYVKEDMKNRISQEVIEKTNKLPKKDYERKGIDEQLLEKIAKGEIDEDSLRSYIAEKEGLPIMNKELVEYIYNQGQRINEMEQGRERDIETAKLIQEVMSHTPVSMWDKLKAFRFMSMLLNFKTTIRNLMGNDMFRRLDTIALNFYGSSIDKVLTKPMINNMLKINKPGQRTALLRFGEYQKLQRQGYKEGFKIGLEDALMGIDTSNMDSKFELRRTRTFDDGILGKAETAMAITMRATDRAAAAATFTDAMQEQYELAELNGWEITEELKNLMTERAAMLGAYRTFNDETVLSKMSSNMQREMNRIGFGGEKGKPKDFGVGHVIVPFPKTPSNIVARAVDYSPLGVIVTMYKLYKETDPYTRQRGIVEGVSRALMGSSLIATGIVLARMGVLTGSNPDDDEDIYKLEKAYGLRDYSVNLSAIARHILGGFKDPTAGELRKGDRIASYDWAEPIAMALAIGADTELGKGDALSFLSTVVRATEAGATALTDQPLLTGVADLFRYGNFAKGATQTVKRLPSSFTPSLLAHVAQFMDGRDTDPYSFYDDGKQAWNLIANRIPGLREGMPQRHTVLGDPKHYTREEDGLLSRAFNSFLNPSITSKYMPPAEAELLFDLYESSGDSDIVPRGPQKSYTIDKVKYTFTPETWEEMSKWLGNRYKQEIGSAMNTYMRGWSAEEQADEIKYIIKQVKNEAREKVLELGTKIE